MPVTLGSNIASLRGQRQLSRTSEEHGRVFQRLSSGQRINRANDDAAGLSIAESLNARSRILKQGVRNLNDGLSLLSIADSAIEHLSSIVMRLEELAAQSANGVYSNKQRTAMDDEAQALSKEFFRISKATEFNGQRLLSGDLGSVNLQAGAGTLAVIAARVGGTVGTGAFTRTHTLGDIGGYRDLAMADLNGDGFSDLISPVGASVKLSLGNGTFGATVTYAAGTTAFAINAADMNGDGILDIVARNSLSIGVLLGRGDGSFSPMISNAAPVGRGLVVADANNDGINDVISGDSLSLGVYLGQGDGTFAARVSIAYPSIAETLVAADFNGDGNIDIAGVNYLDESVNILLGSGSGSFGTAASYLANTPTSLVTADMNGDDVMDLVVSEQQAGAVGVFIGLGNGAFNNHVLYSSGTYSSDVVAGDFNGDGFIDIASADYDADQLGVLFGRGDGTLGAVTFYQTGEGTTNVVSGDLNGDGVLDLVTHDDYSNQMSVFIGRTRDGVAPLLPFSLKTLADARQALPIFKRKREQLATQRGEIGAFQSRIDVARNVLEVSSENFKAAESRIRDADIADESSRLVRLNILQQSASSVLAQANQQPALVLQLLQG